MSQEESSLILLFNMTSNALYITFLHFISANPHH